MTPEEVNAACDDKRRRSWTDRLMRRRSDEPKKTAKIKGGSQKNNRLTVPGEGDNDDGEKSNMTTLTLI